MRRTPLLASALTSALLFSAVCMGAAPATPATPAGAAPGRAGAGRAPAASVNATQPALGNGFMARHTDFLQIARLGGSKIDLLFVGDSITDGWSTTGKELWDKTFIPLQAANFGIGGDTTQSVLWRMQNGELDGFRAKVIILMLGTNNINRSPNDQIAEGDRLIVEEFKKHQPQARILILGIFPRAATAADPYRANIKEINAKLATFADNKQVFYLDFGNKFLAEDGSLSTDIMPDRLHPNARGYQIWIDNMLPKVQELLKP